MVTPWYYPEVGGSETFVKDITPKLNELKIQTDIMTFNIDYKLKKDRNIQRKETNVIDGIRIIKIPALHIWPAERFRIRYFPMKFLNTFKEYDIIHFHNDSELSLPFFSYFVKKPKILHCHTIAATYNFYKENLISRHILKKVADIYTSVSKKLLPLFDVLGINRMKVRLLPNSINLELFKPGEVEKIENLLLYVGRIDPVKGIHVLLKSLYYLKPSIQLVIIGPKSWDRIYLEKILGLVERINNETPHKVVYLGMLKREDIIEWYQKASIFVLPSLAESFGIVNLEALSCETPVVASNVGGISDVIREHETGILVPPNDPIKIAESLQYLLCNEKVRRDLGRNGRKLVEKNFSSIVTARRLCKIYEEMLDK